MKILEGKYNKSDNTTRNIKVFVLNETNESIKGIDLSLLTEEQIKIFDVALKDFTNIIKTLSTNAFRHFKKERLILKE